MLWGEGRLLETPSGRSFLCHRVFRRGAFPLVVVSKLVRTLTKDQHWRSQWHPGGASGTSTSGGVNCIKNGACVSNGSHAARAVHGYRSPGNRGSCRGDDGGAGETC